MAFTCESQGQIARTHRLGCDTNRVGVRAFSLASAKAAPEQCGLVIEIDEGSFCPI